MTWKVLFIYLHTENFISKDLSVIKFPIWKTLFKEKWNCRYADMVPYFLKFYNGASHCSNWYNVCKAFFSKWLLKIASNSKYLFTCISLYHTTMFKFICCTYCKYFSFFLCHFVYLVDYQVVYSLPNNYHCLLN